jgi:hypothetical protein
MNPIHYTHDRKITSDQFIEVLNRTTLGARRPLHDRERIASMLEHAGLLCAAWDGERLVGVARSVAYYPKIGMTPHPSAWTTPASPLLPRKPAQASP